MKNILKPSTNLNDLLFVIVLVYYRHIFLLSTKFQLNFTSRTFMIHHVVWRDSYVSIQTTGVARWNITWEAQEYTYTGSSQAILRWKLSTTSPVSLESNSTIRPLYAIVGRLWLYIDSSFLKPTSAMFEDTRSLTRVIKK